MTDHAHRSADHIERDLAETRLNISQTLDAIQARLSPSNLMMSAYRSAGFAAGRDRLGHAGHRAAAQAGRAGVAIGEGIRANPMAAALVGIGVAWMLLGHAPARRNGWAAGHADDDGRPEPAGADPLKRSVHRLEPRARMTAGHGMRRLGDMVSDMASGAAGLWASIAGSATDVARDTARFATDRAEASSRMAVGAAGAARTQVAEAARAAENRINQTSEVIMNYASTTRERLGRTGRSALHYAEEHPFMTAGAFLAVGALMAAMLPRTRREREIMGDTAASLARDARDMAQDVYDNAKTAAKRVAHKAGEAAEQERLTPAQLKEDARTAAERVRNVASAISQSARDEVDRAIAKAGGEAAEGDAAEGGPERAAGAPGEAGRETRR